MIIWEPVMHYTFFIKDKHHLKVKYWAGEGRGKKRQCFKVYIDRKCLAEF